MANEDPYRQITTLKTILVAAVVAIIGGGLLYASGFDWFDDHTPLETLVSQVGGALVVGVALFLFWDLLGRRSLAREILGTARVGADVNAAGLTRVGTQYLDDVDWSNLFHDVKKLDIFVAYGATWRATHYARLQAVAARPDTRIHVYLPDPDDAASMDAMAVQFGLVRAELQRRITEARADFEALRIPGGGQVKVFHRSGDHAFSCYRFDNTAIITLYSHTRARADVPTLVCRAGGSLYEFVRAEFRAIEAQSIEAHAPASAQDSDSDQPPRKAFFRRWRR